MKINKILLEKCCENDNNIDFYHEIADMLRIDIAEYINMISSTQNIFTIMTLVKGLRKLLHLVLPEDDEYYVACVKVNEIYENPIFNPLGFHYYLNKIKKIDINEYI